VTLAESQQLIAALVTRDAEVDPAVRDASLVGDAELPAAERARIYSDMYLFRLVDALREDYPLLSQLLSAEEFFALSAAYVRTHPSENPSLAHLGRHLPAFLRDAPETRRDLAELAALEWARAQVESLAEKMETKNIQEKKKQDLKNTSQLNEILNKWKNRFMSQVWAQIFAGKGPAGTSGTEAGGGGGGDGGGGGGGGNTGGGQEGGSETKRKPRFPQVLISGQHSDPLDPLSTESFYCDPRQPTVYQRPKDVEAGIYWINTARPLAEKILNEYTADSPRWREYLFQRYTEIILKEAIFLLGRMKPSITADDVVFCMDDITKRVHDQAAQDLDAFLFEEIFTAK